MASPAADFGSLGVPGDIVAALTKQGIIEPFEVQTATLPDALAGRDVLGRAPTGSGKTLAFGIPMLARLARGESRRPRGLILSPTRELAEQIRRELAPLAEAADRSILTVYGGVGLGPQAKALRKGVDLIVACPGRLQDLINQGEVSLDRVDIVVIDEADRMADMGFLPAVRALLDLTATKRQTVLFSATLDNDVALLIKHYQNKPVLHEVGELEPDLTLVTHRFIATAKERKIGLAADLVDQAGATMVFCRTRHGVDRVARQLKRAGVKAGWIHGGRSQNQRDAALQAFTGGRVKALVATDVAARGIHVDGVACVIHFDPPADHKDYVHRSGRTARAGAGGIVVSMVNSDQYKDIRKLQKQVGLPISDPEPMPELTVREQPAWVDKRPQSGERNRSKNTARSDRRTRSEGRSRSDERPGSPEGQRSRPRSQDGSKPRSNDRRRARNDQADNAGTGDDSTNRTGPGKARSAKPGPAKSRATKTRTTESRPAKSGAGGSADQAAGSGSRRSGKAGPSKKSGGAAKAKSAKRSGQVRTKNHKKSRQRSANKAQ